MMPRSVSRSVLLSLALALAVLAYLHGNAERPQGTGAGQTATAMDLARARRDEAALSAARPAARELYDLTRRLRLHSRIPVNPYVRATAPTYAVGRVDTFYVAQAQSGYVRMQAMLLLKTPHAYWYVDLQSGIPRATLLPLLRRSAGDFETHIYPTDRRAFGAEWTPGIDRDPRITVLCAATLPGAAGSYSTKDLYPRAVNPYSNQRKMLYANIGVTGYFLGSAGFAATLAHEFQHMIHWYQHPREDAWINEGGSMLAQVLAGYTPANLDVAFAATPGTQLDDFCAPGTSGCGDNGAAHYGASFQWMLYFYQHYGGVRALRALLANTTLSGMALFDDALARLGAHVRARAMFARWVIANLVDDPRLADGVYGYRPAYQGCCIHADLTFLIGTYPFIHRGQVRQFATDYVQLAQGDDATFLTRIQNTAAGCAGSPLRSPPPTPTAVSGHHPRAPRPRCRAIPAAPSTLHIRFAGAPTVRIIPNTPALGTMEWWSNRGDEMDNTLTRALDLRRVHKATLQYDIWYDTEQDFDYGYVEVSVDGGSTWSTLRGRYTTGANPNGGNDGNGYTGAGAGQVGSSAGWLHERIDLSRYAGRQILVRFEYVTDDAINRFGLALDNVRVPEIGFYDAPGAAGWQSHGWVRVANLVPTHWLVQAILYTRHGIAVRQAPLLPDTTGGITVTGFGREVQRIVLAITPTAAQTTLPASYTLAVR